LTGRENALVARVKEIRRQYVLFQEYDRRTIAAITERRVALQSTSLTELPVNEEISGCSGDPLDDPRRRSQRQMPDAGLSDTLVFIDQPDFEPILEALQRRRALGYGADFCYSQSKVVTTCSIRRFQWRSSSLFPH